MNHVKSFRVASSAHTLTGPAWTHMLEDAFYHSPYAAFVLDKDGMIAHCNRRALQRFCTGFGKDPSAVSGAPIAQFTAHTQENITRMLRDGMIQGHIELHMVTPQSHGMATECAFRLTLLRAPEPGTRFYLMTQDHLKTNADALASMNNRRKIVRDNLLRLEAAHLDLHQSLLAMEAFSRAASHDMRTPLNTLSGLLELFGEKFAPDLPEVAQQYLSTMGNAVGHMTRLTETLLEHAQTASPLLQAEAVEVRPIARQVCMDLDDRIREVGGRIEMVGTSFTVMAEPILLNVLLTNIVTNALKYRAPDRDLVIRFEFAPDEKGHGTLTISDNGIGFPEEEAKAIFKPFNRLATTEDGSGIGLSTCAEVCRRHGWRIDAHGAEGEGAYFTIDF